MEEKDSYPFHFHQTPQIWEAEVVRILDFCQVHVRDSRISLLQQSQEQAVPKLYTTNWTKMIREWETSPYSSWLFWLVVFQSLSCVQLFATPWTAASQASLSPRVCSNSCPLSQWCHPTISSCRPLLLPPSIFPSIRVFSNESVICIRWPKVLEFQLQHQSFQWIFRTDFL